LIAKIFNKQI